MQSHAEGGRSPWLNTVHERITFAKNGVALHLVPPPAHNTGLNRHATDPARKGIERAKVHLPAQHRTPKLRDHNHIGRWRRGFPFAIQVYQRRTIAASGRESGLVSARQASRPNCNCTSLTGFRVVHNRRNASGGNSASPLKRLAPGKSAMLMSSSRGP